MEKQHYNLLINNAGLGIYGPFYKANLSKQQAMMRVNCDALVALSHTFLKQAKKSRYKCICLIVLYPALLFQHPLFQHPGTGEQILFILLTNFC